MGEGVRGAAFMTMGVLLIAMGCAGSHRTSDDAEDGEELYATYCASCHGVEGRGDGLVAGALRKAPPDLTTIASSEGWFPDALVQMIIDGRYTAHGTRVMPVWGSRLSLEELRALTDHLEQIQE
ncbi:MAG: cytochrome c [Myxococcales bacterium]|nr:cytochrome c [Myxococcales bacterium]